MVFLTSKAGGDGIFNDEEEINEDERSNRTAAQSSKNNISHDSDSSTSAWTKTDSSAGDSLSGSKRATS